MNSLGHILIIDDEPTLRQTLTRLLRKADCEVTSAANGTEALRLLNETAFDLIYLDIRLPDLDGLQVLKAIRQHDSRLPVIMLTAFGSLQTALEAMRLGATDYLLKPVDPEVLLARTRLMIKDLVIERRRRAIQEKIEALQAELRAIEDQTVVPTPSALPTSDSDRFIKRGSLILDLQARRASCDEVIYPLPPTSFDYLVTLARHSPEVVDYQTLVTESQGYQVEPREARELAKYHIHVLRQALVAEPGSQGVYPCNVHILNLRSGGYRLLVD